jgi:hypothetical protein
MSAVRKLSDLANEKSTYAINVAFTDEDGDAMTPNSISWDLTDTSGTVINSREGEVIAPDTAVDIVLSGDDLEIIDTAKNAEERELTVYGTFDSDLGSDLPYKDAIKFDVINLVAVD